MTEAARNGRGHREITEHRDAGHRRSDQNRPGQGHTRPRGTRPSVRPASSAQAPVQTSDGAEGGIRLNKYIASTGQCSRRAADELIAAGRVRLNGHPAQAGDRVFPEDTVSVDGRPIREESDQVCLMLHKPVQVVSTAFDPQGRKTVLDYVPKRFRHLRLYPVGRLDYFSEGLLLLTNDGALAQRLTHPSHNQSKVYKVLVRGHVRDDQLKILRSGMRLAEGDVTAPCEVRAEERRGETILTFTLHQGLNRQIRRMCRDVDLTILRLRRVAEGTLALGSLGPGEVRELTAAEVRSLKAE